MRGLLLAALLLPSLLIAHSACAADAGELIERRQALADTLAEHAVLALYPAPMDTLSSYRPSDSIYYLTGSIHPGTHLLLVKEADALSTYLFAKLSDPTYEVWEGFLPSADELRERTGADHVLDASDWDTYYRAFLNGQHVDRATREQGGPPPHQAFHRALLRGEAQLWLELGRTREAADASVNARVRSLQADFPELAIRNVSHPLRELRYVKSASELAHLREAIRLTDLAQQAAMRRVGTADHEYQVEATIEHTFRDGGALGPGFYSIVASGANATVLHYNENSAPIDRNALFLTDVGASVAHYTADITRTYPASGRFSGPQKAIYQLVLDAQRAAMDKARPGATFKDIDFEAVRVLGEGLLELGLIAEPVREQVKSYYLHGIGHSIGLYVHDVFEYWVEFEPDMVITVEPGLYVRPQDVVREDWYQALDASARAGIDAALERYAGIGVRIEDDVLITRGAPEVLSTGSPVTVEAIEALMR